MYKHIATFGVAVAILRVFNQYPWLYILSPIVFPNPCKL